MFSHMGSQSGRQSGSSPKHPQHIKYGFGIATFKLKPGKCQSKNKQNDFVIDNIKVVISMYLQNECFYSMF